MRANLVYLSFLFNGLLLQPTWLHAQVDSDAAAQQAERLIQEEQLRRQQREQARDAQRQQQQTTPPENLPQPVKPAATDASQCSDIARIVLEGVSILSVKQQQILLQPFVQRCLTLNDINQLLAVITNAYFERGYVTSRAYVPAQDLKGGVLKLVVVEGELQRLQGEHLEPLTQAMSFPVREGELLNLRDLEQGIEQLNRLASQQARLELLPGDVPGQTQVRIDNRVSGLWRMAASVDNSGQESTGERQLGMNISIDNLFSLADFLSLHAQGAAQTARDSDAESLALHYDFPWGYWNIDLDFSAFDYASRVQGLFDSFNTSGESDSQALRVSRLWYRDQHGKFGQRLSLKRKKNLNFIEDIQLETSSRVLASLSSEIWYQRNFVQGYWSLTLGYDKGVTAFGGEDDGGKTAAEPRAEFSKWRLNAAFNKNFTWKQHALSYNVNLYSQFSKDILYAVEQISIGSQYTVRGYKEQGLNGNKGLYLRQELGAWLPSRPGFWQTWSGHWRLALGVDAGRLRDLDPAHAHYENLYGWGLRLSSHGGPLSVSLEAAKALRAPGFLQSEGYDIYASITYAYQP